MNQTGIKIVHCKRDKYDIYIGRPAKNQEWGFGNPFIINRDGSREEVIFKYSSWLKDGKSYNNLDATKERREWILDNLYMLKDSTLGCWCYYPAQDCHGRILIEIYDLLHSTIKL